MLAVLFVKPDLSARRAGALNKDRQLSSRMSLISRRRRREDKRSGLVFIEGDWQVVTFGWEMGSCCCGGAQSPIAPLWRNQAPGRRPAGQTRRRHAAFASSWLGSERFLISGTIQALAVHGGRCVTDFTASPQPAGRRSRRRN
jgi:hypothetical protein